MKELELNVQDIKDLMQAMHKNQIRGLRIDRDGFRLELEGGVAEHTGVAYSPPAPPYAADVPGAPEEPEYDGALIRSPIVGIFYSSPGPDQEPFVSAGQKVKKGDVLFIIESMKLMNEVLSEHDGVISSIFVENGQGVEYGQPILCIQ